MKHILYDMSPLVLVRWFFRRPLKFDPVSGPGSKQHMAPKEIEKKSFNLLVENCVSLTIDVISTL